MSMERNSGSSRGGVYGSGRRLRSPLRRSARLLSMERETQLSSEQSICCNKWKETFLLPLSCLFKSQIEGNRSRKNLQCNDLVENRRGLVRSPRVCSQVMKKVNRTERVIAYGNQISRSPRLDAISAAKLIDKAPKPNRKIVSPRVPSTSPTRGNTSSLVNMRMIGSKELKTARKKLKLEKTSGDKNVDYKEMEERRWQYAAPNDILSHISDFLPLQDFINFRSVCQSWRKAPSCRSNITEFSKEDKWCILYDFDAQDRDKCLFYQCGNSKRCSVRLPSLRGATCLVSKSGWLLIRRKNDYLFFNPFTLAEFLLPQYPRALEATACQLGTFSNPPTSSNCVAILICSRDASTLEISRCCLTDKKWVVDTVNASVDNVSISKLLCIPRFAYFCACDGKKTCSCMAKNSISIGYDSHWVLYDFEKNELRSCERKKAVYVDWYSKMRDAHLDDWLRKFGKDFTFSFCLFNECEKTSWGVSTGRHRVIPGTNPTSKAGIVKAAWIEPAFLISKPHQSAG